MQNLVNRNIILAAASLGPNAWLWLVQAPSIAKRTLGVLLVVSATGCGGGGDTGSGETSPTNPDAQPATIRAVGFNSQAPVNLASAEAYAIFSGAAISHAPSNISGDVGVSQASGSLDLHCEEIAGTIHRPATLAPLPCAVVDDSGLALSQADISLAYQDAASRSIASVLLPVYISGLQLTPGLYRTTGALEITSADVLLDAQGDGNAVWIFQVPSTLHVAAGRQIVLSNGAKASNIYWQVGSSVTLGEYAAIRGTILATDSITLRTGATLEGRALTRSGSVNLSANTITRPVP